MDDKNKVLLVEPDRVCPDCGAVKAALFNSYYCPNTDSEGVHFSLEATSKDDCQTTMDAITGLFFSPNPTSNQGPVVNLPGVHTNGVMATKPTTPLVNIRGVNIPEPEFKTTVYCGNCCGEVSSVKQKKIDGSLRVRVDVPHYKCGHNGDGNYVRGEFI